MHNKAVSLFLIILVAIFISSCQHMKYVSLLDEGEFGGAEVYLVDNPEFINKTSLWSGASELNRAARNNNIETVQFLLEQGADTELADLKEKTPIFYAVHNNSVPVLSLLIDRGADINHQDTEGKSSIVYAVEEGASDIISVLIEYGSDVSYLDTEGMDLIELAVVSGCSDDSIIKLNQAGIVYNENHLRTFLQNDLKTLSRIANKSVFPLVESGDPLYHDCSNLISLIQDTDIDGIKSYIDSGKMVNFQIKFRNGRETYKTPLDEIVRTFNVDEDGEVIIHEKLEMIKIFLEAGADLSITDSYGISGLNWLVISAVHKIFTLSNDGDKLSATINSDFIYDFFNTIIGIDSSMLNITGDLNEPVSPGVGISKMALIQDNINLEYIPVIDFSSGDLFIPGSINFKVKEIEISGDFSYTGEKSFYPEGAVTDDIVDVIIEKMGFLMKNMEIKINSTYYHQPRNSTLSVVRTTTLSWSDSSVDYFLSLVELYYQLMITYLEIVGRGEVTEDSLDEIIDQKASLEERINTRRIVPIR